MTITPLPWIRKDGALILQAELKSEAGNSQTLWYRFSETLEDRVTHSADPFVTAALFHIMKTGEPVWVEGTVSPSLLRNLDRYMAAWHHWFPDRYQRVEIRASIEAEPPAPKTKGVIMGFSGGMDSTFTAWNHAQKQVGRQQVPLAAAVFVLGFDIPLEDEYTYYRNAFERSRIVTDSIGVELLSVATNFRALDDWWEFAYASALTSVQKLFQVHYSGGMLASGSSQYHINTAQIRFGSNPFIDGWLGSDAFPIFHDGADKTRLDKVNAVSQWPEALQHPLLV